MKWINILVYLTYFSDALWTINMQSEPLTTTNGSGHMSRDIVWLSDGGDLGDFSISNMIMRISWGTLPFHIRRRRQGRASFWSQTLLHRMVTSSKCGDAVWASLKVNWSSHVAGFKFDSQIDLLSTCYPTFWKLLSGYGRLLPSQVPFNPCVQQQ